MWKWILYYESGKIQQIINYKNWKEEWECIEYYENGQIQEKSNYKNWKLIWEVIKYYNDKIIEIDKYRYWRKVQESLFSNWKSIEETYFFYKSGEMIGVEKHKNWKVIYSKKPKK